LRTFPDSPVSLAALRFAPTTKVNLLQDNFIGSTDRLADSIDSGSFSHQLVPLGLAVRSINARVYAGESVCTSERLTGIAHVVAALAPLYTHSSDGTNFRRLMEEELRSGNFRKSGRELHFIDGRPPIDNIAVPNRSVGEVVRLLSSAVNGEDRQDPE
jgi:hypothetical protein